MKDLQMKDQEALAEQASRLLQLEQRVETLTLEKNELVVLIDSQQAELARHRREKESWDWVFNHALDLLVVQDEQGFVVRVSPSVEQILGYTQDEFLKFKAEDIVHPEDLEATLTHMSEIMLGADSSNFVARNRHKNGEWRWLSWTTPAPPSNKLMPRLAYGVARDITESKLTEQELLYRARHDALTGLVNRASFDQSLLYGLARAERSGRRVALLLIDLDGFKAVNDTRGHLAGDLVLKEVATRLDATQRKGDVVARFGGDEFACLMEDASTDTVETVARRMLAAIEEPLFIDGRPVAISCSIGIAIWPDAASNAQGLFEQADKAMYSVKASGKRGFRRADTLHSD